MQSIENTQGPDLFNSVFDSAIDGVFETDMLGNIIAVNSRLSGITGYSSNEMIGKNVAHFIVEEEVPRGYVEIERFKKQPFDWVSEWRLKKKSGSSVHVEISGSIVNAKVIRAFVRDISVRKRNEEGNRSLAKLARRLGRKNDCKSRMREIASLLVPTLADICIVSFQENEVLAFKVFRISKKSELSYLKSKIESKYDQEEHFYKVSHDLIDKNITLVEDVENELKKESCCIDTRLKARLRRHNVTSYISIPLVGQERVIGSIILCTVGNRSKFRSTDLDFFDSLGSFCGVEIENAKLYLEKQKEVQAREQVLSVVSHDLRNPLAVIEMSAQMLMCEDYQREISRRAVVDRILRATSAMDQLIADLLDFSKAQAGTFSIEKYPINVNAMVHRAIEAFAKEMNSKEQVLVIHCEEWLPLVRGDERRLTQVIWNLVGNSVKFTPRKGLIKITISLVGSELQVSVKDSGPGLSKDDLPKVFDRFWQAKETSSLGVGLGLAIAKGIVRAHGGNIWVESMEGQGCKFVFTVPI